MNNTFRHINTMVDLTPEHVATEAPAMTVGQLRKSVAYSLSYLRGARLYRQSPDYRVEGEKLLLRIFARELLFREQAGDLSPRWIR